MGLFSKVFSKLIGPKTTNDADFEKQVRSDGIEKASLKIAKLVNQKIPTKKVALQFILEELDAARDENEISVNFVLNSGFDPYEYIGALEKTTWEGEESELEHVQLYLRHFGAKICDIDLRTKLVVNVIDKIMQKWKLGKYNTLTVDNATNDKLIEMPQIFLDQDETIKFEDNVLAWVDKDTNLMWEVKNIENIKYWYVWSPKNIENVPPEAKANFDVEIKDCASYVAKLNEIKYAGFNDWRLPTIEELESLIDENGIDQLIKKPLRYNTYPAYWTSTPASGVDIYKIPGMDWQDTAYILSIKIVDFKKPATLNYKPDQALWVRCVRSNNIDSEGNEDLEGPL